MKRRASQYPGGPAAGDGMLPQDMLDELKKRGIAPPDAGDKRVGS